MIGTSSDSFLVAHSGSDEDLNTLSSSLIITLRESKMWLNLKDKDLFKAVDCNLEVLLDSLAENQY